MEFPFIKEFNYNIYISNFIKIISVASLLLVLLSNLRRKYGLLNFYEFIYFEIKPPRTKNKTILSTNHFIKLNSKIKLNISTHGDEGDYSIALYPASFDYILIEEVVKTTTLGSKTALEKMGYFTDKEKKAIGNYSSQYCFIKKADLHNNEIKFYWCQLKNDRYCEVTCKFEDRPKKLSALKKMMKYFFVLPFNYEENKNSLAEKLIIIIHWIIPILMVIMIYIDSFIENIYFLLLLIPFYTSSIISRKDSFIQILPIFVGILEKLKKVKGN